MIRILSVAISLAAVFCGSAFGQQAVASPTMIGVPDGWPGGRIGELQLSGTQPNALGQQGAESLIPAAGNHDLNNAGWMFYVCGTLACILGLSDLDDSFGTITAIGGGAAAAAGVALILATSPHVPRTP